MKGWRAPAALLIWAMVAGAQATPGSWVATAPSVRLFTPGRVVESAALTPPETLSEDARITSVRWRFDLPLPQTEAWLCHSRRCIALDSFSRRSDALAGLAADTPLFFRFRLSPDAKVARPLRIKRLQAIVGYR